MIKAALVFATSILLTLCSCDVATSYRNKEQDKGNPLQLANSKFVLTLYDEDTNSVRADLNIYDAPESLQVPRLKAVLRNGESEDTFALTRVWSGTSGRYNQGSEEGANKLLGSTYNQVNFLFHVPAKQKDKLYRLQLQGSFHLYDSIYRVNKTFPFRRSRHLRTIKWSGC